MLHNLIFIIIVQSFSNLPYVNGNIHISKLTILIFCLDPVGFSFVASYSKINFLVLYFRVRFITAW